MSGSDLLAACSASGTARATCDGYLMAVTDMMLMRERRGRGGGRVCLPPSVTVDQVRDAVAAAANRPAARAATGLRLVAAAMRSNWPCQGQGGQGPGNGQQPPAEPTPPR